MKEDKRRELGELAMRWLSDAARASDEADAPISGPCTDVDEAFHRGYLTGYADAFAKAADVIAKTLEVL